MLRKILVGLIAGLLCGVISYGQFADCSTGLLQAPTAEMQPDGTFMITNNWLNQNALPSSGWSYSTFQYGINITFWERIEIVPDPYYLDKNVKMVELFLYHKLGLMNKYTHLFGDS